MTSILVCDLYLPGLTAPTEDDRAVNPPDDFKEGVWAVGGKWGSRQSGSLHLLGGNKLWFSVSYQKYRL